MKQVYKETFNSLSISDEASEKLMQIPYQVSEKRSRKKHGFIKFAYAFALILFLTVPTITVMAATGVNLRDIFGRLFGENADIVQENASFPEVNVLSNTFENIDINITGIAGDEKLIYIAMDIYKKDGSSFSQDEYEFDIVDFRLKLLNDNVKESGRVDFDFVESRSSKFIAIPDEDYEDNKRSFAYVANIETEIDGKSYYVPGETYSLKFVNYNDKNDFGRGEWEAEFSVNFDPAKSTSFEVNQTALMPRWGTDYDYNPTTEMLITSIELSPFALRYVCEYDNSFGSVEDIWRKLYIEMDDGSFIGDESFNAMLDRIATGTMEVKSWGPIFGGNYNNGPYKYSWIFNKPIDVSRVKAIHFGNLTISVK